MSSELPISSPYRSTPDAPVTESERDQLSSRLNAAFTAGTLDAEDYQARLDTLFAAQRLGGTGILPVLHREFAFHFLGGRKPIRESGVPDERTRLHEI